jgi:hypothetical protein
MKKPFSAIIGRMVITLKWNSAFLKTLYLSGGINSTKAPGKKGAF